MEIRWEALALVCAACIAGCRPRASPLVFEPQARPILAVASSAPDLKLLPSGVVLASLVEPNAGGGDDLFFCTSTTGGADVFTQSLQLNAGIGSVHSHREGTPRLLTGKPGNYYALWTGSAPNGQGMALFLARSDNFGHSFSKPVALDAPSGGAHPYFNGAVAPNGTMIAVWIAYDRVPGAVPETGVLELIRSTDGGRSFSPPARVAIDVCPCCRPEIKFAGRGAWYLSWRHVDPDQERDFVVISSHDDGSVWSEETRVSRDGWHINGCPDSGSSIALLDGKVFVAWYTVIDGEQRLFWSESDDGGQHFGPRQDLSGDVRDPNHPYLEAVGDHVLAAFQGRDPDQDHGWANQRIYLRQIAPAVAPAPTALPHGLGSATYPVMTALGPNEVMTAWTDLSDGGSPRALSVRGYFKPAR